MKILPQAMKRSTCLALFGAVLLTTEGAAEPVNSPEQQIVAAIRELQLQQAQIVENQTKIEAKLVTVGEAVRVARIYSSRGGN